MNMRARVSLGLVALAAVPALAIAEDNGKAARRPTARQIVERIKANVQCPWSEQTVDTFKTGDPDAQVAGIATTFLATQDVLQRAVDSGANFIITHEPTFYNHLDRTEQLEGDAVLAAKQAFIKKHNLIVWRFHDHWHRRQPDGILQGMTEKFGWQDYRVAGDVPLFQLPKTTVGELASQLKAKFESQTIRVVGNPQMAVSRVGFSAGAPGSMAQMRMLAREDVEVLVAGECPEWETVEYVRDAVASGKNKALILLGHANSEEAGMEYCAKWLKTFVTDVPVTFVPAGNPFWSPR